MTMKSFRYDPYLWVHLAGLAAVPIWLDICLLGLAVGYPSVPKLELAILVGIGVIPALLMQLQRPFSIFCLLILALRPSALTTEQRQMLTLFRRWRVRLASLLVPIPLVWVLLKLYDLAPVATELTPFSNWGRIGGLAIAAISFLLANVFLQVPVSVFQVLLMSEKQLQTADPYPTDRITQDFTVIGLPVNRILPHLVAAEQPDSAAPLEDRLEDNGHPAVEGATVQAENPENGSPSPVASVMNAPEVSTEAEALAGSVSLGVVSTEDERDGEPSTSEERVNSNPQPASDPQPEASPTVVSVNGEITDPIVSADDDVSSADGSPLAT
jgi:hypothetical protein